MFGKASNFTANKIMLKSLNASATITAIISASIAFISTRSVTFLFALCCDVVLAYDDVRIFLTKITE